MRLPFLLLLIAIPVAFSLSNGSSASWNAHAYLVKILSTVEDEVFACTGIIIGPSSVLSSNKCFENVDEKSVNALVLSVRGNGTVAWKRKVYGLKKSADFALLTIRPRKNDNICPPSPALPRSARLPLSNNILDPLWNPVDMDELTQKTCRIVGFETVNQEEFHENHVVLETSVSLEKDFDIMTARVSPGHGACWDDVGVPVECVLSTDGQFTVVGLLQGISADDEEEVAPEDYCTSITGMKFNMFYDGQVGRLLNDVSPEILKTFKSCFPEEKEKEKEEGEEGSGTEED